MTVSSKRTREKVSDIISMKMVEFTVGSTRVISRKVTVKSYLRKKSNTNLRGST
jgi:hypothetical protein